MAYLAVLPRPQDIACVDRIGVRRPVSRVLSFALRRTDGYSSGTPVTGRLTRPTRTAIRKTDPVPSLFGLAPGGACHAACVAARAVRSYRTISPLPRPQGEGGLFSVALSLGSPPADVIRHRVSVEPGLSSRTSRKAVRAAIRPSDAFQNYAIDELWAIKVFCQPLYDSDHP